MNPVEVFRMVKDLGGKPPRTLIVGCEPESFGPEEEGMMGLTDTVAASIDEAVRLVEELMADMTQKLEVG
ncbi:MAG: hydrogenase maturation protease, partial [Candidatus Dormibacteraeota bacterium]|nr:hydrogenase maturation protease [Candidatus Dormibacteraeota bacterium]